MGWLFHASDPMGGAAGEAYANTLASPGMHQEHVLAREAIQNSVDAGLPGAKVVVRFRAAAITGAKKAAFVAAASLGDLAARASQLKFSGPTCLATLDKPKAALPLLYVEDYNAVGLSGPPHDMDSNFFKLLLSLGDRSKARTADGSGGSYGFGKSVYSSSSAIRTIFAYTRFKGADGKESTRVFGCGYFRSHAFDKESFSGRAWLGVKQKDDKLGRVVIDPLENGPADQLAAELGFELRGAGKLGTSILIVDAAVNIPEIVHGVEQWWWPRLVENNLDVIVEDSDGASHPPRPRKSEALRPFIEAFDIARVAAPPKDNTQRYAAFNKEGNTKMGACGFVVVPLGADGSPAVPPERCNCVALIRRPRMVVSYEPLSSASPSVVGAYVAPADEPEVESALRDSEPPAHDRWDKDSTNLRDETGRGSKLVETILKRIKDNLRRFQVEAAPPKPPKQRRLTYLERTLSAFLKPQNPGPSPGVEQSQSPLHIEFTDRPRASATDDGLLRLKGAFIVRLDEEAPEAEVDLLMKIHCPVLEDDSEEGDDLKMDIKVAGVSAKPDQTDPSIYRFTLARGAKARFSVESESYDPSWTVRLRPTIEREDA